MGTNIYTLHIRQVNYTIHLLSINTEIGVYNYIKTKWLTFVYKIIVIFILTQQIKRRNYIGKINNNIQMIKPNK